MSEAPPKVSYSDDDKSGMCDRQKLGLPDHKLACATDEPKYEGTVYQLSKLSMRALIARAFLGGKIVKPVLLLAEDIENDVKSLACCGGTTCQALFCLIQALFCLIHILHIGYNLN